jgi:Holliday junction resolvase RusA-like endonuclease
MTSAIHITVIGKPEPAGSKRAYVNPKTGRAIVTDDNPKGKVWQWAVACAALEQRPDGGLLDGPLEVEMTFYRPRPQGHYRSNGLLRGSAPAFPTTRPDALKLARGCEDALSGVLWRDDSQIVAEHLFKEFGEPARVEITVTPINTEPVVIDAPLQLALAS